LPETTYSRHREPGKLSASVQIGEHGFSSIFGPQPSSADDSNAALQLHRTGLSSIPQHFHSVHDGSADKVGFRRDCANDGYKRMSSVLINLFVTTSAGLGVFPRGYAEALSVLPVLLALIDIEFCGLRAYLCKSRLRSKLRLIPHTPQKMADRKRRDPLAGSGYGIAANIKRLVTEQRKILDFDKDAFIFILSATPVFDQLTTMLWIFAGS
tara:strand:+ start:258 stop:890 length:633 start_codon:yes stop_codon:yes gene_type:complete